MCITPFTPLVCGGQHHRNHENQRESGGFPVRAW
jgi:hypothetical protein